MRRERNHVKKALRGLASHVIWTSEFRPLLRSQATEPTFRCSESAIIEVSVLSAILNVTLKPIFPYLSEVGASLVKTIHNP